MPPSTTCVVAGHLLCMGHLLCEIPYLEQDIKGTDYLLIPIPILIPIPNSQKEDSVVSLGARI